MEIWSLYQKGELHPEIPLTGRFERNEKPADLVGVMREINDTLKEEQARQLYRQQQMEKKKFVA